MYNLQPNFGFFDSIFIKMKDLKNFNLLPYNTFGIEAYCKRFVEFDTVEELSVFVKTLTQEDSPLLLLGGGSNLLLTGDYPGTVLHSAIKGIGVVKTDAKCGDVFVRCGSGEVFDDVVAYCVEHGYYGMENLSLIPGEVGASAVQNIGAYGAEAKDVIQMVEAIEIDTGKKVCFSNADCKYSYRQSKFKNEWRDKYVITYVTYRLSLTFQPNIDYGNIRERLGGYTEKVTASILRNAIIDIRRAKLPDPKVQGNGGSFFMNPIIEEEQFKKLKAKFPDLKYYEVPSPDKLSYKIPAGWMIEQCGWKGKNVGPAGVHDKQALVLVNLGGAKGKDIIHLCEMIQRDVKTKFGVDIYPEVNIK